MGQAPVRRSCGRKAEKPGPSLASPLPLPLPPTPPCRSLTCGPAVPQLTRESLLDLGISSSRVGVWCVGVVGECGAVVPPFSGEELEVAGLETTASAYVRRRERGQACMSTSWEGRPMHPSLCESLWVFAPALGLPLSLLLCLAHLEGHSGSLGGSLWAVFAPGSASRPFPLPLSLCLPPTLWLTWRVGLDGPWQLLVLRSCQCRHGRRIGQDGGGGRDRGGACPQLNDWELPCR